MYQTRQELNIQRVLGRAFALNYQFLIYNFMITSNFFVANGTVENGKVVRSKAAAEYGSWFSDNATPAELASWADARIKTYESWIEKCKALKKAMQKELLQGFDIAELQALLEAKQEQQG